MVSGGGGGGAYNPDKSMISTHLSTLTKILCHYSPLYDNIVLIGDFNSEYTEDSMHEFYSLFNFVSLIKNSTCFKSVENPLCIDLILTNRPKSFQKSMVIETGLSDFHKLTITVLKRPLGRSLVRLYNIEIIKNSLIQNSVMSLNTPLTG